MAGLFGASVKTNILTPFFQIRPPDSPLFTGTDMFPSAKNAAKQGPRPNKPHFVGDMRPPFSVTPEV
jgi:hypothetical protein